MNAAADPYIAITRQIVAGELDAAEAALGRMLAAEAGDARAHMLAAKVAGGRRDAGREREMLRRAAELDPGNGEYAALLARSHARAQDLELALESVAAALACAELSDLALDALAATLAQFGRHREAADLLQRAADEGTRNPAIFFNLGNNLRFAGDFSGARQAFLRAIELAPRFHKAHAALSSLGGITAEANNLDALDALIARSADPREAIHLRHAAAKECEALGRYDDAWEHLTAGKKRLRAVIGADLFASVAMMDRIAESAAPVLEALPPAGEAPGPIFILGMPRSGTTVLDRIVSNHDVVTSIGESLYFAQLLKIAAGSHSRDLLDVPMLAMLQRPAELEAIGARYREHGAQKSGGAPRFVDKFHLNFMLAGHLMRALPDARLLCIVRDPLDTIVSNYRQLFEFESTLYHYGLDVEATAEFYVRFRRLAAFWEAKAPDRFRTVRYEALVADPDREARGLLEFCGLDWQEGVTAIERNAASVATASAVQVRSAINGKSVGNWRRYARHLDAVRARLAAAGLPAD